MVDPKSPEPTIHENAEDARAGSTPGVTRYILGISLALIVVLYVLIFWAPKLFGGQ